jgi:antitoxin CcdA
MSEKTDIMVDIDAKALEEAKELGLDINAAVEAALVEAISEAKAQAWREENATALNEEAEALERHGDLLKDIGPAAEK